MQQLKRALYADAPLDLLALVSTLVVATDPRGALDQAPDDAPRPDLRELVETFVGVDLAPTTAALHVIAAYTDDELLERLVRDELARRTQPMPRWLVELERATVSVVTCRDAFGDGINQLLGLRLADGQEVTVVVYLDSTLGNVVKDAFVVPQALAATSARFRELDADLWFVEPDPGVAHGVLDRGLSHGAMMWPPLESDTWPAARALVQWVVGLLPEAVEPTVWEEPATEALARDFLASEHGAAHRGEVDEGLLRSLLWLATGYASGDPLQWSPLRVDLTLTDLAPRKIRTDPDELRRFPDLLRSFVRFAHDRTGVPQRLTDETLEVVDQCEPDFLDNVRDAAGSPMADLLRQLGLDDGWRERAAEGAVGGPDALAALDDEPLPDEDFDWTGVPDDIRGKIAEIAALCDERADEALDVEHRTAMRRLLHRLATQAPDYFKGRAAARTSAVAVVWMVAHANETIGYGGRLTATALLAPMRSGAPNQRAATFLALLGLPEFVAWQGPMQLGSPELLVARRRARLMGDPGLFGEDDLLDRIRIQPPGATS